MFEEFWAPIKLSISITLTASAIVFTIGTMLGWFFATRSFRGKTVMETFLMLPLVLPPSVIGFGLIVMFGNQSVIGQVIKWIFGQSIIFTWWAAVLAAIVVAFPLMFQSAKTGFQDVNRELEEAAMDLGATKLQTFLTVSIPLASKSIIAGGIMSFARALGEFGATLMFAGNIPGVTQTVPTAIYMAIDMNNMKMAWLWVISIIFISFLMLFFVQKKGK